MNNRLKLANRLAARAVRAHNYARTTDSPRAALNNANHVIESCQRVRTTLGRLRNLDEADQKVAAEIRTRITDLDHHAVLAAYNLASDHYHAAESWHQRLDELAVQLSEIDNGSPIRVLELQTAMDAAEEAKNDKVDAQRALNEALSLRQDHY